MLYALISFLSQRRKFLFSPICPPFCPYYRARRNCFEIKPRVHYSDGSVLVSKKSAALLGLAETCRCLILTTNVRCGSYS